MGGSNAAIGTLTTSTGLTFNGGSDYLWHINNATGTAGTNYDTLNITGALNLSNLNANNKLNIDVSGLSGTTPGTIANFSNLTSGVSTFTWTLATATSITNPGGGTTLPSSDYTIETDHFTNNNSNAATGTWSLSESSGKLQLTFVAGAQAANLVWNTPSGGTWDTTPSNQPWLNSSSPSAYTAGANVTFPLAGVSQFGTTTVTVDNGSVAPAAMNITNTSGTYIFAGSGITGGTSLNVAGTNGNVTAILNNANTYTGGTNINSGILQLGSLGSLPGTGTVTIATSTA